MEAAHSDDRDALRAKLAEAEARIKEWTENENGENYDFQIQGLLLRQTVEERDEARSRAEAAEAKLEIAINATATQVDAMLAAKLEAAEAERDSLQMQVVSHQNRIAELESYNHGIAETQDRLQAEVARLKEDYWHPVHCCRCGKYVPHTPISELYCFSCYHEQDGAMWVPQLRARISELEAGLREALASCDLIYEHTRKKSEASNFASVCSRSIRRLLDGRGE